MSVEVMLQRDIFSGELVDTRTASQRRRDERAEQPQQIEMFSQRVLAQYVPRPMMPLSAETRLVLVQEDPRTDEEKEADRERAARALTTPMFAAGDETPTDQPVALENNDDEISTASKTEVDPEKQRAEAITELEMVVKDITQTLAATPEVLRAQSMWLALATIEAQTAGVPKEAVVAILRRLDGASPPRPYPELSARRVEHVTPQSVIVFEAEQAAAHLPMSVF
ncbi:MAG: hypothetical protein KC547_11030 [Anaerolineae bacterium]|nr:hypothetical protein [Anaerolineae bacterium]